jgi:UDP-2,4-diacetamido-2,4,6-trideoxy-beta-L-altropyranose hydrolase
MGIGTLLIRADASPEIGTGHVMRCLALAQAWQDRAGSVVFAIAKAIPAIEQRLRDEKCSLQHLTAQPGSREDADRTKRIARECAAKWIVLDGYEFDSRYQLAIREAGFKLLCVDDLARHEKYSADILLNQNLHAIESMYANKEGHTRCLLGPQFALLRREFLRAVQRQQQETGTKVLVMMGGSDPANASEGILGAISAIPEPLEIIVVVGPGNLHSDELIWKVHGLHQIQVVKNPEAIADLMLWADVAVSAAGSTVWEMCRLGLPAVLVSIADNQVPGAQELDHRGIAIYLGEAEMVHGAYLARELRLLLLSPEQRQRMSHLGQELVDGQGSRRVVGSMMGTELKIRRANVDDCWLLWQWVNDPRVRAASFRSEAIPKDDHAAWFARKLNSGDALIYVAEDIQGVPIGQFRVEWDGESNAVVDVSVAPERRGAGIAAHIIAEGAQRAFSETDLRQLNAYIKPENGASLRAFERAQFSRVGEAFARGQAAIHFVRSRELAESNYSETTNGM